MVNEIETTIEIQIAIVIATVVVVDIDHVLYPVMDHIARMHRFHVLLNIGVVEEMGRNQSLREGMRVTKTERETRSGTKPRRL